MGLDLNQHQRAVNARPLTYRGTPYQRCTHYLLLLKKIKAV